MLTKFKKSELLRQSIFYNSLFKGRKAFCFAQWLFVFYSFSAYAQWPPLSVPNLGVSTTSANEHNYWANQDGLGGAYVAWEDNRGSSNDIYAQRFDNTGYQQWAVNGVAVCVTGGHQHDPISSEDGLNNSVIAWEDDRAGSKDVYAQKIDLNGTVQWTLNGVLVCSAAGNQVSIQIIADGLGGTILVWEDDRGSTVDIYAQKLNSGGVAQWTANGVLICGSTGGQSGPQLVSDGSGGAIITWQDRRGSSDDIYAQWINASGIIQWTANGNLICNAANSQTLPQITTDGSNGAIIVWEDKRSGTQDVYSQRIDAAGVVQWTANGVVICNAANSQTVPQLNSDAFGGAVITWEDKRSANADIYAQRVNGSGTVLWTANGIVICNAANTQAGSWIAKGNSVNSLIIWEDNRSGTEDVYFQMVDLNGVTSSPSNGTSISTATDVQLAPLIFSTGVANWIAVWRDDRNGNADLYAQGLDKDIWAPLPVELLSFQAKCSKGKVNIEWVIASQKNNDYFSIERTADGKNFETIGFVDGEGNTNQTINYFFVDGEPLQGISYYRLEQTDFDGKSEHFNPVSCTCENDGKGISIYPNPGTGKFTIEGTQPDGALIINNSLGKKNYEIKTAPGITEIDLSFLEKGIYFLRIQYENGNRLIKRIIIL